MKNQKKINKKKSENYFFLQFRVADMYVVLVVHVEFIVFIYENLFARYLDFGLMSVTNGFDVSETKKETDAQLLMMAPDDLHFKESKQLNLHEKQK